MLEAMTLDPKLPDAIFAAGTPLPTCAPGKLGKLVPINVGAPYIAAKVMLEAMTDAPRLPALMEEAGMLVIFVPVNAGAPYIEANVMLETIGP